MKSLLSLRVSLLIALLFVCVTSAAQESSGANIVFKSADYKPVNVRQMIKRLSKPGDKQRYFIAPAPVKFSATLMQKPRLGRFELVYDSLSAWGVSPLPKVDHGSYLKVEGEQVIPVYLETKAASFIKRHMVVDQQAEFYALHIYNYEKGPRFLVVSVDEVSIQ